MSFSSGGSSKVKTINIKELIGSIFLGKRYQELTSINDQVRYLTMNSIFIVASLPLIILGVTLIGVDSVRMIIDFAIAGICLICLVLMRTKVPFRIIPIFPVTFFGLYCLYLIYVGELQLWTTVWFFSFPLIVIFLCQMTVGVIESVIGLVVTILFFYTSLSPISPDPQISFRYIAGYVLILTLTIVYERISVLKDRKELALNAELAHERDIIQTMKDNIQQGIFLMNTEYKILSLYSRPLITILSYYDTELEGKNFLDILAASLDARQLQTMKGYFEMIFSKSKSAKVLESVNPISEFEYKIDDRIKILATKFHLIEQEGSEPVIIGIIQDITREKEFEKEMLAQKEAQELEMKNMFDVIQVDPLVFNDFIEDTESNFKYINAILKDKSMTERQVVNKFFQNIHAIKSNALVLGLENFGKRLHVLEDNIKKISAQHDISLDNVLDLAVKLEDIMQEKDSYTKIVNKIEAFKTSNRLDSVLVHTLTLAIERIAAETQKKVELKTGQMDMDILGSRLRKPIKDILFQCVRNSIYHGIEPVEERIQKHKKPQGLLVISIKNVDGRAEINFSDDGRGLDWNKIKNRYLVMNPNATDVSRKTLLLSIFSPEFSTSEETTTVAGRGVGLSLVRDLVKENAGTVNVNSSDTGLTFKFTFPFNN